jgi:ABC-2 type transport system permease protein
MNSGIVDRFRSLPMLKSAILGSTVLSVAVRCLASVVAMLLIGWLAGFRPQPDFGAWLAAMGLILLVSYAFSWLLAVFGVMAKSVEGPQQVAGFVWPLFLLSTAFVPAQSLPGVLRGFAGNQPMTHAWITVGWCLGIILESVPLASMWFRRKFS